MSYLVLGLVLFLGIHSLRIVADDWRNARVAAMGRNGWKALHVLVSLAGLALMVWGYGVARMTPVVLWQSPVWARHAAGLLTLVAFCLVVAAYVPSSRIRGLVGHPMVAGLKLWAFGHLLANGTLADLVLFGSLLAWAVVDFTSLRRRDRAAGTIRDRGAWVNDLLTVLVAVVAWYTFAFYVHAPLIGATPFG